MIQEKCDKNIKFSRREFLKLSGASSVAILLNACGSNEEDLIIPDTPDIVKRANLRGITYGAAIAKAKRYFEEYGIDDQELIFRGNADQIQALATNDVDIATSSNASIFFNSISSGIGMKFVCDNWHLEENNQAYMLVIRPNLVDEIKTIQDLKGRVVANNSPQKDGGINFTLNKMFDEAGMSFNDIEWENIFFPDMLAALGNGSVDAAWLIEPFITLGKQQDILTPLLSAGNYDPGAQIAGIVYSNKFISERPNVAKRWMLANLKGLRDYNDYLNGTRQEEIAQILANYTGFEISVVEQINFPPINANGLLDAASVMAAQELLVKWEAVEEVLPVEDVIDHQFVEFAFEQINNEG